MALDAVSATEFLLLLPNESNRLGKVVVESIKIARKSGQRGPSLCQACSLSAREAPEPSRMLLTLFNREARHIPGLSLVCEF